MSRRFEEVQSDLFRESGVNATTSERKIGKYAATMVRRGGWGRFPSIRGSLHQVTPADVEDYDEAEFKGWEHELAWSRPLRANDVGRIYVSINDGHNRAWAARAARIPIRVRVF